METATPPNELHMLDVEDESMDASPESPKVAQFSLLPTTQTTTVVTTTTVSTTFPPVIFKKPRKKVSQWDSTTYPLNSTPTPKALRSFTFELDGKLATFAEKEDTNEALVELQTVIQDLRASPFAAHTKEETTTFGSGFERTRTKHVVTDAKKRPQADTNLVQSIAKRRQVADSRHSKDSRSGIDLSPLAPRPLRPKCATDMLSDMGASSRSATLNRTNVHTDHPSDDERGGIRNDMTAIADMTSPQSLSLPSPSASPTITARDFAGKRFESTQTLGNSTADPRSNEKKLSNMLVSHPQATSMLEIPAILDTFDDLPASVQSYIMYHLLKRCNKNTLHIVASVVNPALKRDFLDLLPYELSLHVISYLDARSLTRAAQVSKRWHQLVDEDEYTWKTRLELDQYYVEDGEFEQVLQQGITNREPSRTRRQSSQSNCFSGSRALKTTTQIPKDHFAEMVEGGLKQPLVGQHLYKTIYKRHHINYNAWMNPRSEPKHLSFESHGRHVVTCLQMDEEKIITGSEDSHINIFDIKTGDLKLSLEGHEGGVWALQYYGNLLVSGSTDRTVRIWDMISGQCLQVLEGHTSTVRCLQILPTPENMKPFCESSHIIITGSRDSTLRIWRLPGTNICPNDESPDTFHSEGRVPYFVRTLTGHTQSVRALAADGDILVSGSYDCSVRVWCISTGKCLWRLNGHTQKVYSVVLDSKQGRCISGSMDCKIKIWDLATGQCLHTADGHDSLVGLLSLSHDRLVSAAADTTLRVWDKNGQCVQTLAAHTGAITCFQHDDDKVISGSDGTLKLWDLKTGKFCRDLLVGLTYVWQVRFDGRRCVAAVQRNNTTFIEVLDFGPISSD